MPPGKSYGLWPVARPGCFRLPAVLLSAVLVAGCQTTPSLEEATKVSVTFEGKGTVDPATGKTVFSYAHPIFWAPFTLIGDGGAGTPFS